MLCPRSRGRQATDPPVDCPEVGYASEVDEGGGLPPDAGVPCAAGQRRVPDDPPASRGGLGWGLWMAAYWALFY